MQGQRGWLDAANRPKVRAAILTGLRLSPWLVFGPITGVMSEAAVFHFRRGRRLLGALCIVLNVGVLVAIPLLTAYLAHRLK
ncbi:MAG TPA: hypothetical protein VLI41_04700 [Phenylobacterium sp.]|uniref:hypothetical protein n=1 Tax=Phenylobacterium sp. TaxID=1871053 RepID=UPI002C069292|nr:hypothetical protein [Phenylobacterium sp.]HSV02484.1 hypothetical protein [Phenylobacterium sp.]